MELEKIAAAIAGVRTDGQSGAPTPSDMTGQEKGRVEQALQEMAALSPAQKKKAYGIALKKISREHGSVKNAAEWKDDLDGIQEHDLWSYFYEDTLGDAKLYNALNRGRIVFVAGWSRFLVWAGHHWQEDEYNIAFQRVEAIVGAYDRLRRNIENQLKLPELENSERRRLEEKAEQIKRRIRTLRSRQGKENILAETVRIFDPIQIVPDEIDQQPYMLPCPNGVINLKTGRLLEGRPGDYLLNAAATPYFPALLEAEDPCPETSRFLLSSMGGDQSLVDFLWQILGYGLIRERREHIFPIFWGAHGRNGKDTLIKLITKVMGKELSSTVPVELILQTNQPRNSSAPSPDVMALRGTSYAWINEAEDGQRFAMSKIKQLTGGGNITARGLQDKRMTTFLQTHLPILTTNELPKSRADDTAFWSRILIVKWELSFVDDPVEDYERPAIKNLDEILQAEAPGVLARMVRGAMDYLANGRLTIPEKVRIWTQDQRDTMDDLGAFLDECCIQEVKRSNPDEYQTRVSAKDLNDAWAIWYTENRDRKHIPSAKALGMMLEKREIPRKRSGGIWRLGIQLNAEWQDRIAGAQGGEWNDAHDRSTSFHSETMGNGNDYDTF